MNSYVGLPENFGDVLIETQSKVLAQQIRDAIRHLKDRQMGKYEAVVTLLETMIGEGPDYS